MRYMLDTNTCIELIRRKNELVIKRLKRRKPDAVCLSSVTLSELEYGVEKSDNPAKNRLSLAEFVAPLTVMPYDDLAASQYGKIRASLEKIGLPIGPLDMMIAAHALSLGLTVVTDNEREFRRVPGLEVQNWAR